MSGGTGCRRILDARTLGEALRPAFSSARGRGFETWFKNWETILHRLEEHPQIEQETRRACRWSSDRATTRYAADRAATTPVVMLPDQLHPRH